MALKWSKIGGEIERLLLLSTPITLIQISLSYCHRSGTRAMRTACLDDKVERLLFFIFTIACRQMNSSESA